MSPSFIIWLDANQDKFKTYSLQEIADLAVACGFSREDVSAWQTREKFRRAA